MVTFAFLAMTLLKLFAAYLSNASAKCNERVPWSNEPEHCISYLIHFPCSHKCNISRNGVFQHVSSPIELTMFLSGPRNLNPFAYTTFVVADRYCALLYRSRCASGSKNRRYSRRMGAQTFGERTLWYEFQGYLSLEVKLLKVLIPIKEGSHGFVRRRLRSCVNPPIYEDIILSTCPVWSSFPTNGVSQL